MACTNRRWFGIIPKCSRRLCKRILGHFPTILYIDLPPRETTMSRNMANFEVSILILFKSYSVIKALHLSF